MHYQKFEFEHSLPIDLTTFGFVHRETTHGHEKQSRCMRDFLYYSLHYYHPEDFGPDKLNPKKIERSKIFGWTMGENWTWTALHIKNAPALLKKYGLRLKINNAPIKKWWTCFNVFIHPPRLTVDEAIELVKRKIDQKEPVAIDVTIRHFGVDNHVMFVFAYDKDNFYTIDTHDVEGICYTKMTDHSDPRYIMQLPIKCVREKWTRFGRVWTITKIHRK